MHLDMAKLHTSQASDKTDELKKLNRSIFRPAITFNKDAKRRAQEQKIQDRYDEQKTEREKAMIQVRETQDRVGRAQTYGRGGGAEEDNDLMGGGEESLSGRRYKTQEQRQQNRAANSRYRFEATASDDELEDELDDNLDEIGDSVKRLRALGLAMGQEVDAQNKRIDVITTKTDNVDNKLFNVTARVGAFFLPSKFLLTFSIAKEGQVKSFSSAYVFHEDTREHQLAVITKVFFRR
jgi:protein transport protein SEC9